jgi:hypothetical protein
MKRCPACNSLFPDTDQFCEVDGTILIAEPPAMPHALSRPASPNWILIGIIAVVGVALGVLVVVAVQLIKRDVENSGVNQSNTNTNELVTQQPIPQVRAVPSPSLVASPSPEASPSPSPTASPAQETPRVAASTGDVSTGGNERTKGRRIVIQLTNGNAIEADDVWETSEGVWYRRHGVVSLLQRDRVKAIETEKASASTASSSPTPTSSPTPQ